MKKDNVEKKRKYLYATMGLLLLLILIIILSMKSCGAGAAPESLTENEDPLTTGSLSDAQAALLKPDYFNIRINSTPVLKKGKLNLRIENSSKNTYGCRVEVVLSDDATTIYRSQLLNPGQSLENCTISKELPSGTHPATACYTLYDLGTGQEAGKSNVKLSINVE